MTDRTIQEDVPGLDQDDDDVFLARYAAAEEAAADTPVKPPQDEPEETEEEGTTEEPEEGSEEETEDEVLADDGHKVTIKVGEEEHKVSVGDLKRLFGQEAALTQKSQALAESTKRVEGEGEKATAIMSALLQRAEKAWAPYANVDLNLAAARLPEAAYKQLRADMLSAHQDLNFLRQESNAYTEQVRVNRLATHAEAMKVVDVEMAKVVPDWTAKSRSDVVAYAKAQGLNPAIADGLADPSALQLVRKAMLFDKGAKAVATKVTPTAKTAPTKTLKPGSSAVQPASGKVALERLRRSGSIDDAAEAFLARFGG